MVYVVETFQLSDEVRADPSFGKWLQEFNSLVLERNPAVKSLNMHAAYIDALDGYGLACSTSSLSTEASSLPKPSFRILR